VISIVTGGNPLRDGRPSYKSGPIRERERGGVKKKVSRESRLPPTAPICAFDLSAPVELTPPTPTLPQVQEKATPANIIDIGRYLRWADKAMAGPSKKRKSKKPKAA
jgi:hypothetical protein